MKIKTRNINDYVKRITIEGNTTIHILINNSEDIKCIEFFRDTTSIIFKRNHFSILNNYVLHNNFFQLFHKLVCNYNH